MDGDQAGKQVEAGDSGYGRVVQRGCFGRTPPRTWTAVSKPGWQTPSWLFLAEIRDSLEHAELADSEIQPDFRALLQAMTSLETELGPRQSRLVFWFDN